MTGFLFTPDQIATLIDIGGLGPAVPDSPLYPEPPGAQPLHPNHPAFTKLTDVHALEPNGAGWRVNILLGAAMQAALEPDEVMSVGTGQLPRPRGFSVVRRDDFLAECTVDGDGNAKLYFPLSRSQLMLLLGDALTSNRPEPEPTGFRFTGPADDAFVFATAMRELRELPGPLTVERLRATVRREAGIPGFAAPFATTAGPASLEALTVSGDAIDRSLQRLSEEGHLRPIGGALVPSPAASTMLGAYPEQSLAVSRAVLGDGGAKSQTLSVSRVGGRTLTFRIRHRADGPPLFEWAEVNRAQLRVLVTALLMTEEQFRLATAGAAGETAVGGAEEQPEAAINYCPHCGSPADEGFQFCPTCGRELPDR